jgi:hypothetical protein
VVAPLSHLGILASPSLCRYNDSPLLRIDVHPLADDAFYWLLYTDALLLLGAKAALPPVAFSRCLNHFLQNPTQ